MLRLLAQRGEQGYDDIAALKGLSTEDVRAQVRDAVKQLEDEGLPPPAIPGMAAEPQAEPEAPKPPAPEQPEPPVKPEPSVQAAPPPLPPPPLSPPRPAPKPPRAKGQSSGISLPKDRGVRAAIGAGVLVVVAVIVVLIVGGGGGGGSSTTSTSSETEPASAGGSSSGSSKELTKAVLSPVPGGEGSGVAIFGRVKNKLALQVEAQGLQPTSQGESYTVWLAESPQKMLPLASTETDKHGRIAAQFEVPTEVLAYLANETFGQIVLSRTSNALLKVALKKATSEKKSPAYTGTHVLEGTVTGPIVGAAKRLEEAKKESEGG